jgi:orotate phosphoribosyltransferase
LVSLSNYNALIEQALSTGYVSESDVELLKEWRMNPSEWKK